MARTIRDLLEARLGTRFTPFTNRVVSSVGTSVIQVLRQDPSRVGFVIVNLSANVIFLTPIGTPSSSLGIRLGPSGGSVTTWWEEDGESIAWEWRGVADAAASAIYTLEYVIAPEG